MTKKVYRMFLFVILCVINVSHAQELPPIQVITPQDYTAGNQNWAISQDSKNVIYIANNKGLLQYNGANWLLYDSPNESILRSVEVIDDKIYTGGYMDFGCWVRDEYGILNYTSLLNNSNIKPKEDEEFWAIIELEGYILFQSFDNIYIFNTSSKEFRVINSDSRINKIYKVKGVIYYQKVGQGIFKIENGSETIVSDASVFKTKEIINIFDSSEDILLQTKDDGFYILSSGEIRKWAITSNTLLNTVSVYSSIKLRDGGYMLGTISNGIVQLDKNGNVVMEIDQSYGLSNNTVLSINEDTSGNIWLGLDNGVNVINSNSPFKVYKDTQGVLGTIYTSVKTEDFLYLGTNQGLFYRPINSNSKFEFIKGTEGQVWSLELLKNTLFCGHDMGTFIVDGTSVKKITDEKGTWAFMTIREKPNLIIQGNYKGFNIIENINNQWVFRNKVTGFDISSRYFEFCGANEILVSHEYKGVYRVKFDSEFRNVEEYVKEDIDKGINSSVLNYNGDILYSYKEGVFHYDIENRKFIKDSLLSKIFSDENYLSGKLINDEEGKKLWGFSNNGLSYLEPGRLSNTPEVFSVPIPIEVRKSKTGYENILFIKDNTYLMGTTEGYLTVDLNRLKNSAHNISLNTIAYNSLHHEFNRLVLDNEGNLSSKDNSLHFTYSVANYNKLTPTQYQYKLNGIYDNWSTWSASSEALFENLPHGEYSFEVRAKVGDVLSSNTAIYEFNIARPWYLKPLAIVLYILLFLAVAFMVHYLNKRYYKKQKQKLLEKQERELELEQLESQKQLMQYKNRTLQLDIDNKNRELGMATMNLIKRNELLNSIKDQLSATRDVNEIKDVVKLINRNLNNTDDWKLFEEAFNNADKDFLKKIKTIHPSLTPNDLRLCAYLRLNLSSKEVAPLLNISIRSVEVKRYRLRKKMNLSHETSLTNYILEL